MSRFTDALTYALSVGLAAGVIVFATYKVVELNGMENPPANMGLNFPPPKRKIITDDSIDIDTITTQSTARETESSSRTGRILQPYSSSAQVLEYRLLTVIDGVAFVEMETTRGREIAPVVEGSRLPGSGRVESIGRSGGKWVLVAGRTRLVSEAR